MSTQISPIRKTSEIRKIELGLLAGKVAELLEKEHGIRWGVVVDLMDSDRFGNQPAYIGCVDGDGEALGAGHYIHPNAQDPEWIARMVALNVKKVMPV